MGLVAVLAVLLDPGLLLECLHGGFRFASELAVHHKGGTQLIQKLLQGFDVRAGRAVLQQAASQRVHGDRLHSDLCTAGIAVIDKRQLVPVCPGPFLYLRLHAAPAEALPLHSIAVANVVSSMTVLVQRQTRDLRQGVDGAPVSAFLFCPGEHAVRTLVRASVGAIFAGDALVRPDGFKHALTAVCPGVAFAAADAVGYDSLVGDVLLVTGHTAGSIRGRILVALPGQQAVGCLIDTGTVPVRLAHHLLTPVGKVLVGERRIDSFRHLRHLHIGKDGGYSPSPWSVSSSLCSFSLRSCSCSRMAFSLSGMGRPM